MIGRGTCGGKILARRKKDAVRWILHQGNTRGGGELGWGSCLWCSVVVSRRVKSGSMCVSGQFGRVEKEGHCDDCSKIKQAF